MRAVYRVELFTMLCEREFCSAPRPRAVVWCCRITRRSEPRGPILIVATEFASDALTALSRAHVRARREGRCRAYWERLERLERESADLLDQCEDERERIQQQWDRARAGKATLRTYPRFGGEE